MATAAQQPSRQQPAPNGPGKQTQEQREAEWLTKALDQPFEFTPFMAKDSITLTARRVMHYLCKPTKLGKVCDERDATRFVMLCKARGLNPWEGDAYIVGYDAKDGPEFTIITAHQAFLKRAEVHPEYDGMESGVLVRRPTVDAATGEVREQTVELEGDYFEKSDTIVGGWARVHFKTRKYPIYKRLKLETFHKGFSRWNVDPAGMIVKCAEADALRSAFPNSLVGMYLEGEIPPETERDTRPTPPPVGRHSLRNRTQSAGPPEPTADEVRAAEVTREILSDLGNRIDLAESHTNLQQIGRDALERRAAMGEEAYREFERRYQERFNQIAQPATREPGDDGE